jgi:molybdopterin-guanine dinucleotide biosynthesis protein A
MKSAAILAGGSGRRMGWPKIFLNWYDKYFYEMISETLGNVCEEVFIVTSKNLYPPKVPKSVSVVIDKYAGVGPLAGIYTALCYASGDYVFVCGVDMPFVSDKFVKYMFDNFVSSCSDEKAAFVPFLYGKYHPLHALYMKDLAEIFSKIIQSGEKKVTSILKHMSIKVLSESEIRRAGLPEKSLVNINDYEEYEKLKKIRGNDRISTQFY